MAGRFRHEDVGSIPQGWRVRTVKHGNHRVRVAFPPGRKHKESGRLVAVLHPIKENPCSLRSNNPAELLILPANPPRRRRKQLRSKNPAELMIMGANPRIEVVHGDNPPAEVIAEEFSGVSADYIDIYNEPHIPRGRYAYLGKLLAIYVKPLAGGQVQRILFNKDETIIVSDTTARQIYFVGGNQDISAALTDFGAEGRGNGLYEIGAGRRIDYEARKEHVAKPDEDKWKHDHGEEDGELPTVLFDARNKKLLYEGGNYRIDGPWMRN